MTTLLRKTGAKIIVGLAVLSSLPAMASRVTTADKLHMVAASGKQQLSRKVARAILANWRVADINRTGKIGFWWYQKHDRCVGFACRRGKVDTVYVHAFSDAVSRPGMPWEIKVKLDLHRPSKHLVVEDFAKVGFLVLQNDGSDEGAGGKVLAFLDGDEPVFSTVREGYERTLSIPDASSPDRSYRAEVKGFLQEDLKVYSDANRTDEVGTLKDLGVAVVATERGEIYLELSFDLDGSFESPVALDMRVQFRNAAGSDLVSKDFTLNLDGSGKYFQRLDPQFISSDKAFGLIVTGLVGYFYSE